MKAHVLSQVTLSFMLPFAILPMLIITGKEEYMGTFVNRRSTTILGYIIASIIIVANVILLYLTFTGKA